MNKKQKKNLIRIIIASVLMIILTFVPAKGFLRFILYLIPYFVVGGDVLKKAFKGIKNKQAFDESLLMAIATIGAMAIAVYEDGDYTEAIAVMLFYQIGEWFQSYAVGKSRRNISELMDIRPDYANIEDENGQLEQVDPDEIEIGTIIVVQPGEKVPIDGIVEEGTTSLNTSALTGESVPREVKAGNEVISGCININGLIKIRTTKEFGESTCFMCHYTCCSSAVILYCFRCCTYVGNMDLQSVDIPCYKLSMCIGYKHSTQLFCRHRWCKQRGCACKRFKLS